MSEFMLGCNYWASHAGIEMWKNWDAKQVENDFKILSENGIRHIRIFPLWRDFQPVMSVLAASAKHREYLMEGCIAPTNPYFLDETMLDRFEYVCDLAKKYNLKIIVGLITGFMSGRTFIPNALNNMNLFTDPTALQFEMLFIKGFIKRFNNREEIIAWNPGNECNNLSSLSNHDRPQSAAYTWLLLISNAIRACDNKRPVISGMHGLKVENGTWLIEDQTEPFDMVTTHPYPAFVPHCSKDPINSIRTLMHATAESMLYSNISHRPCLVEEIGTLSHNICEDKISADFMRVNLFSNWSHGMKGLLWWCAHDQDKLTTPPYNWSMLERELGMLTSDMKPKEHLIELDKFGKWLDTLDFEIEKPKIDAHIILSHKQDQWGMGYMSFILGKQAGVTLDFVSPNQDIPDGEVYIMPSTCEDKPLYSDKYEQLKKKVFDGATLYISNENAFFTQFEQFIGNAVEENEYADNSGKFMLSGQQLEYKHNKHFKLRPLTSTVLANDEQGDPIFTVNQYGKGKVYFLAFPYEKMLCNKNRAFDKNAHELYKFVLKDLISKKDVISDNSKIGITQNGNIITAINYSDSPVETSFVFNNKSIDKVYYGNTEKIAPCDAVVFSIK